MKPEDYMWDFRTRRMDDQDHRGQTAAHDDHLCRNRRGPGKGVHENLPETAEAQAIRCMKPISRAVSVSYPCPGSGESLADHVQRGRLFADQRTDPGALSGHHHQQHDRRRTLADDGAADVLSLCRSRSRHGQPEPGTLRLKMPLKDRKPPLPNPRDGFLIDSCLPASYADINLYARR